MDIQPIAEQRKMLDQQSLNIARKRAFRYALFFCLSCLTEDCKSLTEDMLSHVSCVCIVCVIPCKNFCRRAAFYILNYIEKPRKHTVFGVCKICVFSFELSLGELRCATSGLQTVLLLLANAKTLVYQGFSASLSEFNP